MLTCISVFTFFFQIKGSTLKHGISLRTLIRKSSDLSGPCLLVSLSLQFKQAYASLETSGVLNYYMG